MAMRNIILLLFGLPTLLLVGCETVPYRSQSARSHYDAYGNVVESVRVVGYTTVALSTTTPTAT